MTPRHRWSRKIRTYGDYHQTCFRCGLVKSSRFAYNHHWVEYWRDGNLVKTDKAPQCIPLDNQLQIV